MKHCIACRTDYDQPDWTCPNCGARPQEKDGFQVFAPAIDDHYGAEDGALPFSFLAEAQARNFWFRARNRLIGWLLRRHFADARSVLEIGCGTGFVLQGIAQALPQARLAGSDIHVEGLSFARRRTSAELLQMDACAIPFTGEFDLVCAFDVLEHIEDDRRALREIHRALTPGGGVLLAVPQHMFLWSTTDERSYHFRRYERPELTAKLTECGFHIERMTSFMALLLPAMLASRRLKYRNADSAMTDEYTVPGPLNALFEGVLAAERGLIRAGVDFPWGGSLFAVARRDGA